MSGNVSESNDPIMVEWHRRNDEALNFLRREKPETVVFCLYDGFIGSAKAANPAAQAILNIIDGDNFQSGASFSESIGAVFSKAQKELGYRVHENRVSPLKAFFERCHIAWSVLTGGAYGQREAGTRIQRGYGVAGRGYITFERPLAPV